MPAPGRLEYPVGGPVTGNGRPVSGSTTGEVLWKPESRLRQKKPASHPKSPSPLELRRISPAFCRIFCDWLVSSGNRSPRIHVAALALAVVAPLKQLVVPCRAAGPKPKEMTAQVLSRKNPKSRR